MTDSDDACGCCAGNTTETPEALDNAPGLPAISYRVGTWSTFRSSLLARLSSSDFPALSGLSTRRDDDWTIGLCDAFATLGDVLTFYQERIANEAFLRTAVERRSVLELARLVGYQLAPGVAASTALAFTMDTPLTPDAPPQLPVTIAAGTRLQSVPGPDELAQTFETIEDIVAHAEWNALGVQLAARERPYSGQTAAWLAGSNLTLSPGDAIAIIGAARVASEASDLWEVRVLTRVDVDAARDRTRIEWAGGLGHFAARNAPPGDGARLFVLRQRAAIFGSNAIDPNTIDWSNNLNAGILVETPGGGDRLRWIGFALGDPADRIELDAVYPKIAAGSWLALTGATAADASLHDGAFLYRVTAARAVTVAKFALSGKVGRITVSPNAHLDLFDRYESTVYSQSEELAIGDRPLRYPVYGHTLALASRQVDLAHRQKLALAGKRQRIVAPASPDLVSFPDDLARLALPNESFIVLAPPVEISGGAPLPVLPEDLDDGAALAGRLRWEVEDRDGKTLTLEADVGVMTLAPALARDATVTEIVTIDSQADSLVHDLDRTTIEVAADMCYVYDRATLSINANVANATHGETVGEIGGSGDGAAIDQRFLLRQSPLTYVPAGTAQGREATLTVRVNDLEWQEARTLYGAAPTARVYSLRQDDDHRTTVQFGDGIEGARLPTGTDNVRFAYRRGLGVEGNVRAGTITSLILRPLGVRSVANPLPAEGGEDPESQKDARRNAPNTVLTMDRAVSVLDYGDFARAFAGIARAVAAWIPAGPARGMHLTVAGAKGTAISPGSQTYDALLDALRAYGDELLPLSLASFVSATFVLKVKVSVLPDHDVETVLAAVDAALRADFSFDVRDFGMPVTLDEVMASVHRVDGVQAVDIDLFYRDTPGADPDPRIFPSPGTVNPDGTVTAAEILTIDEDALVVEVMT